MKYAVIEIYKGGETYAQRIEVVSDSCESVIKLSSECDYYLDVFDTKMEAQHFALTGSVLTA